MSAGGPIVMKRIFAILRPEKENDVIAALEKENFYDLF
jgi:nitrogen regulatory protein PII